MAEQGEELADQLILIWVVEVADAVRATGAVGAGQILEDSISMPFTSAWSMRVVNWMTYWPEAFAGDENCWMMAMFWPPAAEKMSKLVKT